MSKIRLHGSSSGYTEIAPVAASGNNTLTLPNDGTIISKDAAGAVGVTSIKSSNVNVGAAVTITESGIEASGIGITCANLNGGQIGGRRNIVINGAMEVAQRGTSSTADSYQTVDRFKIFRDGVDENPTQTQHTLSSSDSPYAEGLRYSYHFTNGNQTSVGADDTIVMQTRVEAQDMATCGWNYTDPNSFITLSYWVKSSVSQTFYNLIRTSDGTGQMYDFPFALTANTWKKVTHLIPGNSNLAFNNDTGLGLIIEWTIFRGTNDTTSSHTSNVWATYSGTDRVPDMTNTWYDTDDSTFEITGVQLEVGSQATAFEHRSFGEELSLCQRYFYRVADGASKTLGLGVAYSSSQMFGAITFPVTMRTEPTLSAASGTNYYEFIRNNGADYFNSLDLGNRTTNKIGEIFNSTEISGTSGHAGYIRTDNSAVYVDFGAEI